MQEKTLKCVVNYKVAGATANAKLVFYDEFDAKLLVQSINGLQEESIPIPSGTESAFLVVEVKGSGSLSLSSIFMNGSKIDPKELKLMDTGKLGVKIEVTRKGEVE